jgi:hypothetical protein
MTKLEIKRKELDFSQFVKRTALESDFGKLITEDCLITEENVPKILYIKLDCDTSLLRYAVKKINYQTDIRTGGLKTTSRIFGFNPRNPIRRDFCSATSLSHENPKENKIICDFGIELARIYERFFPNIYQQHKTKTESNIRAEWTIGNTPFTSGIVNKNNPLKYHFDAGNTKDVLSNMVVFKKNVSGGFLSCPEFDIGFEVADNTAILFDGQKIIHGVTPIKMLAKSSYRYSIVYYTLEQMWKCLILDEEIARARKVHFVREGRRITGKSKEMLSKEYKNLD